MVAMITPELYVTADGSERWRIRFRVDRRATSKTFADQRGALEFSGLIDALGPAEAVRVLNERLGVKAGTHTVKSWATEHIESLSGVQGGTKARYRAYVRNDLGRLGPLPLTAVTPDAVSRWVTAMHEEGGGSGKTIKNKHGFLSSVFEHAVRSMHVTSNPCKGTRLPKTVRDPMVFLTHDEYARFLDYITPRWQPLVATMFSTGLRWGEITALQVGDVTLDIPVDDLNIGTITVTRAWKESDGGRELGPPKSEKSRRTITLAPETVEVLRPLMAGRSAKAWLFTNTRGDFVKGQTFHDNVWQPAVRLANGEPGQKAGPKAKRVARRLDAAGRVIEPAKVPLGKRPRPHDARHTCASWLLARGIPITYVQAHLGHESITTTVDRYGHLMPDARRAIAEAMSMSMTLAHPQVEGAAPIEALLQIGA